MSNKTFKLGIGLLVLAILLTGGFVFALTRVSNSPTEDTSFPKTFNGLSLDEFISGPEAISMLSSLHGSDIPVKQGYIATYTGAGGKIMIWISESAKTSEAEQLYKLMDQKILAAGDSASSGQPPFTDRKELEVKGRQVITVQGMGMTNYYYQIDKKVYWVAVADLDPMDVLQEVMAEF